eukprot:Unigene1989_Nuclearia_a/m.6191 Unigene1989_Nuclearia_a/g.6191  ORF Unigene1989_Nuclearia_a/g.6191 Unigene1989_Nuclearia_a/m.6191 type:complete len:369 (-) Unigene1989_Nuclearia_a:113-1219(-)
MQAYVTLATNDAYALGALVLARSLEGAGSTQRRVALVTDEVTTGMLKRLGRVFNEVVSVQQLDSGDARRLALLKRPELGVTFTKLHLWKLTQYAKVVFLDSDVLVLKNIDDLFEQPELSAAPDAGWPDCFNSGVFVACPSLATFEALEQMATSATQGSFDGGDQGLLNDFFPKWNRISFTYNVTPSAFYSYMPAMQRFQKDIKAIHYVGARKPWVSRQSAGDLSQDLLNMWWAVHDQHYLHEPTAGLYSTTTTAPAHMTSSNGSGHGIVGTDPKTLRPDRLQHLENFMTYRATWLEDHDTLVGEASAPVTQVRKFNNAAEMRDAIVEEMRTINVHLEKLRLDPKKNETHIERHQERLGDLSDALTRLK